MNRKGEREQRIVREGLGKGHVWMLKHYLRKMSCIFSLLSIYAGQMPPDFWEFLWKILDNIAILSKAYQMASSWSWLLTRSSAGAISQGPRLHHILTTVLNIGVAYPSSNKSRMMTCWTAMKAQIFNFWTILYILQFYRMVHLEKILRNKMVWLWWSGIVLSMNLLKITLLSFFEHPQCRGSVWLRKQSPLPKNCSYLCMLEACMLPGNSIKHNCKSSLKGVCSASQ